MLAREADPNRAPRSPDAEGEKPAHQRPELAQFWDHRFRQGATPWDAGAAPRQFIEFVESSPMPLRTLVPGCGTAWEAGCLDAMNWPVCALDFSPEAIAAARKAHPEFRGELVCNDFFRYVPEQAFDLIYERALLCAMPRSLWHGYAARAANLLVAGGRLAGYFFVDETTLRGPPFGIGDGELAALMDPHFELVERAPAIDSIGPFKGREHWMVWRRR